VRSAGEGGGEGVQVLVVPHVVGDPDGRIRPADLLPEEATLRRISDALDSRRLIGTRLLVTPPAYVGLTVVADVHARERYEPGDVHDEVLRAIYRLLDPLVGGPHGTGWVIGQAVQAHHFHACLARIAGVDMSQDISVSLFPADALTGRRDQPVQRLDVPENGLVLSYEHQVRVR